MEQKNLLHQKWTFVQYMKRNSGSRSLSHPPACVRRHFLLKIGSLRQSQGHKKNCPLFESWRGPPLNSTGVLMPTYAYMHWISLSPPWLWAFAIHLQKRYGCRTYVRMFWFGCNIYIAPGCSGKECECRSTEGTTEDNIFETPIALREIRLAFYIYTRKV